MLPSHGRFEIVFASSILSNLKVHRVQNPFFVFSDLLCTPCQHHLIQHCRVYVDCKMLVTTTVRSYACGIFFLRHLFK